LNFTLKIIVLGVIGVVLAPTPSSAAVRATVTASDGIRVTVDASGHYSVDSKSTGWVFLGEGSDAAGHLERSAGADAIGKFQEIGLDTGDFTRTIRAYANRPVILFGITTKNPFAGELPAFPRFTTLPRDLRHFSHGESVFAPPSFKLEENATPWLLFNDHAAATIISPANNFFLARMSGDGSNVLASGLNPGATNLPAGFTHRTLMAFGAGINATWDCWGHALTDLNGKIRPANDADVGLRYLGYWTDNGAAYYYNYDPALGYAGTLETLVNQYHQRGIPIRYLQLDSWWYYKTFTNPDGSEGRIKNAKLPEGEWNRYGGLLKYEAHPAVLPEGLAGIHARTDLPLITHNRWIDPASPYHERFQISGFAAVDRAFWDELMAYIRQGGVVCYEQDWLDRIYKYSPALAVTPGLGEQFSDGMANAARAQGLSVQYCMGLPRNFLQTSHYNNLTTIRTSDDRFNRGKWDWFLYTSRLASALGVWPWTDVFNSGETDNLMIATLSAGMVGIGDRMGAENRENLLRSARPDGVLVKPDTALVPTDATYISQAADPRAPFVATARTEHGSRRTTYVFAYNRRETNCPVSFTPADFGLRGDVWVYEPGTQAAARVRADHAWTFDLKRNGAALLVIAPAGSSRLGFFGDAGKFVGTGHKRIIAIQESGRHLIATVNFAPGENSVRLFGYAERQPKAAALDGVMRDFTFDPMTGRFEFTLSPSSAVSRETPGQDPVQQACVRLSRG
jgi:hypothetical protein